jgi:hypothetical protein
MPLSATSMRWNGSEEGVKDYCSYQRRIKVQDNNVMVVGRKERLGFLMVFVLLFLRPLL